MRESLSKGYYRRVVRRATDEDARRAAFNWQGIFGGFMFAVAVEVAVWASTPKPDRPGLGTGRWIESLVLVGFAWLLGFVVINLARSAHRLSDEADTTNGQLKAWVALMPEVEFSFEAIDFRQLEGNFPEVGPGGKAFTASVAFKNNGATRTYRPRVERLSSDGQPAVHIDNNGGERLDVTGSWPARWPIPFYGSSDYELLSGERSSAWIGYLMIHEGGYWWLSPPVDTRKIRLYAEPVSAAASIDLTVRLYGLGVFAGNDEVQARIWVTDQTPHGDLIAAAAASVDN